MGVLNVTPDSFSDGGRHADPCAAADAAARMAAEGADLIDVGGESTRPGAARVDASEQVRRVVPAISAIRALRGAAASIGISVDTTLPEVARRALDAGADAINDVSAGREGDALEGAGAMMKLAASRAAGLVLMHRLAPPDRDAYSDRYRTAPAYRDVVAEVAAELRQRSAMALDSGVGHASILIDPGLGFGKNVEQNLQLIRGTRELLSLGFPLLSATSRKSFVGRVSLGRDSTPDERLAGSIAFSLVHLALGARIFRVHDVAPQAQALRAAWTLTDTGGG
jgi:dihydropteroate synthase